MKSITMLEFRRNAEQILARVRKGERIILSYRGKPVARLEPIRDATPQRDDPFYALDRLAGIKGEALSNDDIDSTIYGNMGNAGPEKR